MGLEEEDGSDSGEEASIESVIFQDENYQDVACLRSKGEETNASGRDQTGSEWTRDGNMTKDVLIAMKDIDRTMEGLRTGRIKAQYGTLRSRPSKEEA